MNPTKVELVLREAMEVSGLDSRNCGFFHVSDPLPQPEVADTIVSLVYQCVRDWRPDRRVQLWHLPFERVVAAPLRALDHLFPHATEAAAALEAFIACIEAPLLEHERLLADALVTPADIVGVLARVKLAQHRATIDALRQKPRIKLDAGWITVHVFSADFQVRSDELAREARVLQVQANFDMAAGKAKKTASKSARKVLKTWTGVPTV